MTNSNKVAVTAVASMMAFAPGVAAAIADVFADEKIELRPLGRPFDGEVEKTLRVRSTCLTAGRPRPVEAKPFRLGDYFSG